MAKEQGIFDFEKEIKLKRLNPDFLSGLLIKNLIVINSKFDYSFSLASAYRKRLKAWEEVTSKPLVQMDLINKKVERSVKISAKILQRIKTGKDCTELDRELQGIVHYIQASKVDFSSWSGQGSQELDKLIYERQKISSRRSVKWTVVAGLLNGKVLGVILNLLVFGISFVCSFSVGEILEKNIVELGPVISKLIPAIILFFTLERLVRLLETRLTWYRVIYLYNRYEATILNINKQARILRAFEEFGNKQT